MIIAYYFTMHQEISENPTNFPEPENRNRRTREKNYAPIDPRIKRLPDNVVGVVHPQTLYQQRQARRAASKPHQLPNVPLPARKVNNNRTNALRRIREKTCRCPISPYLKFSMYGGMSVKERVYNYNRNHKCKHTLRYNVLIFTKCPCGKDMIKMECDHERETQSEMRGTDCVACGHRTYLVMRDCECTVYRCAFCKLASYTIGSFENAQTTEWCNCGSKIEPIAEYMARMNKSKKSSIRLKPWMVKPKVAPTPIEAPPVEKKVRLGKFNKKAAKPLDIEYPKYGDEDLFKLVNALSIEKQSDEHELVENVILDIGPKSIDDVINSIPEVYATYGPSLSLLLMRIKTADMELISDAVLDHMSDDIQDLLEFLVMCGVGDIAHMYSVKKCIDPSKEERFNELRDKFVKLRFAPMHNFVFTSVDIQIFAVFKDDVYIHNVGDEEIKRVEVQGGMMSTVASAASSSLEKIQGLFQSMFKYLKTIVDGVLTYTTDAYKRVKLRIKSLYIGNFVMSIKDVLTKYPSMGVALVGSVAQLFTESTQLGRVINLITLGSIITSIAQVAKNTTNTSDVSKLISEEKCEGLGPSPQDLIEEVHSEFGSVLTNEDESIDSFAKKIEKQTSGDDDGSSMFVTMMTALGKFVGFGKDVVKHSIQDSMKYAKEFNIIWTTKRNLVDLVGCILSFLPQWLRNLFTRHDSKLYIRNNLGDVKTPLGLAFHESLTYSIMNHEDAPLDQVDEQKTIAKAAYLAWLKHARETSIVLDAELMRINSVMDKFLITVTKPRIRKTEPFVLRISGASGVGKSTLWPILMSVIPEFSGIENVQEIIEKTYSRQIGDEYWTGYNQQPIVLYDDFGQDRDETDFKELINVVSRAPYLPNMASINPNDVNVGVKGTQFTSKYVVCLSNIGSYNPVHLASAEALNRRRHVHFDINFKEGVKTRSEDFSHVDIRLIHAEGVKEQTGHFFSTSRNDNRSLSLEEAMDVVSEAYGCYVTKQEAVNVNVNQFLMAARTKRVQANAEEGSSKTIVPQGRSVEHEIKAHQATKDILAAAELNDSCDESLTKKPCDKCVRIAKVSWANTVYNILKRTAYSVFEAVIAGAGVLLGMFLAAKAINWYVSPPAQEIEVESGHNKTPKYVKPKSIRVEHAIQAEGDNTDVVGLVQQNVVRLTNTYGSGNSQNALFVSGKILLTNRHCFSAEAAGMEYVPDGTRIEMFSPFSKEDFAFEFDSSRLYPLYNSEGKADACIYVLPGSCASRRSLVHLFWDGKTSLTGRAYAVAHINRHRQCGVYRGRILKDDQTVTYSLMEDGRYIDYTTHHTIAYDFRSQKGDCGTPIVCEDNRLPTSIVGIHCGGLPDEAFGLIITRKMLERAIDELQPELRIYRQSGGIAPANFDDVYDMNLPGKIIAYGTTPIHYMPPGKTVIQPSPLFDKIKPHTTIPAKLNMFEALGEGVDIMRKGIEKYSHPSPSIPAKLVAAVRENMSRVINNILTVAPKRVLSVHEAINGLSTYPHMGRMNMKTSAGFPYSFDPRFRGDKSKLFTVDDNGDYVPCAQLQQDIEHTLALIKSGVVPELPFIDCLKDERRPIEKVNAFKTRVFSICPLVMTIITRMYMLPFVSHITQTRHKSHSALGINKNSVEWHRMMLRLMEVSNYGVDGDYTEFDGRSHKQLMMMHYDLANDYFVNPTDEDRLVRKVLCEYICESLHLFYCPKMKRCFVYMCNGGNPSGQSETTPNNTTVNEAALQIAWLELAPLDQRDLTCYNKNVRTIIYGDDNIYAASPDVLSWYNPLSIQTVLSKYGMIYGPADKKSSVGVAKKLEDCSFLKCSTIKFENWMVPNMHDDALFETLNWIRQDKNSPSVETCCEDNCNDVLRSLFFKGEHAFNEIRDQIKRLRPRYALLTFEYLKGQFLGYGSITDPYNSFGYERNVNTTVMKYDLETMELKTPLPLEVEA